jgi:hypothetical protein
MWKITKSSVPDAAMCGWLQHINATAKTCYVLVVAHIKHKSLFTVLNGVFRGMVILMLMTTRYMMTNFFYLVSDRVGIPIV